MKWADIKCYPECVLNLRKFTDNYNWSGLEFPVETKVKDIREFENANGNSINVLALEGREIYIHRKTNYKSDRVINLLIISENSIQHYTAIKSLSRLLSSSNSKHKRKQHFCTNCLQDFIQELSRDQHQAYSEDNESVKVEIFSEGSTVEFRDGQNQFNPILPGLLNTLQTWGGGVFYPPS